MRSIVFASGLMFTLWSLATCQANAQPRPATGGRPTTGARPAAGSRTPEPGQNVAIRSIEGIRQQDRVQTPEYTTSARERSRPRHWGCITVEYETVEDWTDELEFRYFVLVQEPKTKEYRLFTKNISYIEIAGGRHISTVFLRPNTLERHGPIERAAVEIWEGGQRVAAASAPKDDQPWWQMAIMAGKVRVDADVLLNRAETPFAFVAYDNYQTIKPSR